jgi:4'-phosphopantetheinyl transferase
VSLYPIDLWVGLASTSAPGALEACCESRLPNKEREDAKRFRRATSRNQHIVGRGMARTLLASDNVLPQEIEFTLNPHGKPDVLAPLVAKRPFNIAHTEGMVVFASCDATSIGIDVERLARTTDIAVAKRFFAAPEVEFVMSHEAEDDKRLAFLRVWTLKEAFIKAVGKGLAIPLADFSFNDIDSCAPTIRLHRGELGDADAWRFACISPADGFVASVAVNEVDADGIEVRVRDFLSLVTQAEP